MARKMTTDHEELLVRQIWSTHEPDGRWLDAELLVRVVKDIMLFTDQEYSQVSNYQQGDQYLVRSSDIEVIGSEEQLGNVIAKISNEMLRGWCMGRHHDHDIHMHHEDSTTLVLFNHLLRHYNWDAKASLVLAAFALRFADFCLPIFLLSHHSNINNPLAAHIAKLKNFPNDLISILRPRFRALREFVDAMVSITKCIIRFQGLPLQHVSLDHDPIFPTTKPLIHNAVFWVVKSASICFSSIMDLNCTKTDKEIETITIWKLSSFSNKLTTLRDELAQHVDSCYELTDAKLYNKFLTLFKDPTSTDNQNVLSMLFALKDQFPLMSSSLSKLGVSELKNKTVACFISRPELLSIDQLILLIQQLYDDPYRTKLQGSFDIVWFPISSSSWSQSEMDAFYFLANSLPWLSVRQPWRISPVVIKFMKAEWNFNGGEPIMVVMDPGGRVTNVNGLDMMLIWGIRSYPFSTEKERELWEVEKWSLQLLLGRIDPLVMKWVEEDKNICMYGSRKVEWICEFKEEMDKIIRTGLDLGMISLGSYNSQLKKKTREVMFWIRAESMRRFRRRQEEDNWKMVEKLMESDEEGWVIFGKGSDLVMLKGMEKVRECLEMFQKTWGKNVAKFGVAGAIRRAFNKPSSSDHEAVVVVPYSSHDQHQQEGDTLLLCDRCESPMEKFVLYKCDGKLE
ncbi:protein SIEVE ELEMENT OCCLUSION C-like [Impatiens glandulifera]|uniref:protein SIEVE ELEMENT OCCLUSION C-like n=1 Tax=Impatiens glandulifera TaxID=253017 RepID=UPI001FB04B2E|nr:protein SIEVE ELEMENT OCCLUSION C-like [Impatiens glandulifera]